MIVVGIDPDREKSGIAVYNKENGVVTPLSMSFFELFDFFVDNNKNIEKVKIEGGWLNKKANFRDMMPTAVGEKIARDVGANHEVGKKIVEMCDYFKLESVVVRPFPKEWNTASGKISHGELLNVLESLNVKLNRGRTTQDIRDSILIALF